jgi:hypothetical protein
VSILTGTLSAQDATNRTEPGLASRNDILLVCDFEQEEWWQAWGSRRQPVNTVLVGGDKAHGSVGRSLQVTTPRGEHTGTSFAYKFRERLGAEPDEIYFRYYLKFDPDWKHATSGGKLPGISGTYGKAGWGGRKVNGSDGWSARGLFETRNGADSTAIGFYCYHADMRGRYGENWRFQPRLEHGRWYCVEQYCKLNTPGEAGGRGKSDGILRSWIDGLVAFEKADIRFRGLTQDRGSVGQRLSRRRKTRAQRGHSPLSRQPGDCAPADWSTAGRHRD